MVLSDSNRSEVTKDIPRLITNYHSPINHSPHVTSLKRRSAITISRSSLRKTPPDTLAPG